ARRAWEVLAAAQRRDPDRAAAVLTHPAAGPALVRLLVRLDRLRDGTAGAAAPRPSLSWFTALAAAAAVRSGLPERLRWTPDGPWVTLPSVGHAHVPGAGADGHGPVELEVGADGRTRLALPGAPGGPPPLTVPRDPHGAAGRWQGAHRLAALGPSAPLLLDTIDPPCFQRAVRAPDGMPEGEVRHWRHTARAAVDLLAADHAELHAELAAVPWVLVPLVDAVSGTVSGSNAETFGCLALSRPATATRFAVTLAHEAQHNKFAALLHLFDLFEPGGSELYYASWRPDPRPLLGLFHGAYAHLGVARFWNRQRESTPDRELRAAAEFQFTRWRAAAREATAQVLGSPRLTPLGHRFAEGMLTTLDALCRLPVAPEARRSASASARAHRSAWRERNGPVAALPA
ncbi:HEXXH motif domain-containing protein, partial [Streptomyces sp. SID5785]|uniref:aKG-HExxH-type peptide beta-hydroxylase n=1 Tax=Streptomyces sp. SID5785 TaxID=2690309 RepID=UPI001360BF71